MNTSSCALQLPPLLLVGCRGYMIILCNTDANESAFLSSSMWCHLTCWPCVKFAMPKSISRIRRLFMQLKNALVIQEMLPACCDDDNTLTPNLHFLLFSLPLTPSHAYSPYTPFSTYLCSPSFLSCPQEVSPSLISVTMAAACPSNGHETTRQRESSPSQTPACNAHIDYT